MRILLEQNADPNLVDKDGGGPLHAAACYGSFGHDVEQMRRKHSMETKSFFQSTGSGSAVSVFMQEQAKGPRESTATNKTTVSLNRLSTAQASGKLTTSREFTHAAESEEAVRLDILRLLLESGRCIVDLQEVHGCTPLWQAAGRGWTRAVEALLDAGAAVDPGALEHLSDTERRGPASPLMLAVGRGNFETARVLLAHGARVPKSFDIDRLCSMSRLPADIVDELRAAATSIDGTVRSGNVVQTTDMDYRGGPTCESVPSDAFAQPPARKTNDDE